MDISLLTSSIGETVSEWLIHVGIPKWLAVLVIAMLPIIELRGALPVGLELGMPWYAAFAIAVVGNIIPVPIILAFFPTAEKILRNLRPFELFFDWIFKRTRKKTGKKVTRFRHIALVLFVAIPLPITGAWTGCLVAYLYGLNRVKSFFFISLGVTIAGVIVLAAFSLIMSAGFFWGIIYAIEIIGILIGLNRIIARME